ncbi:hypothetical protein [Burkholderia diffusa]|uniref:hypothetical protein n=1 Tax=Burkholderia diffusa TaxID=488732 RepID=UPI0012D9976B
MNSLVIVVNENPVDPFTAGRQTQTADLRHHIEKQRHDLDVLPAFAKFERAPMRVGRGSHGRMRGDPRLLPGRELRRVANSRGNLGPGKPSGMPEPPRTPDRIAWRLPRLRVHRLFSRRG